MTDLQHLIEQFEGYLQAQGLKMTRQRQVIMAVFFARTEGHYTLTDLLHAAQKKQSSIGYATVYRTMKLMTDAGVAVEHKFTDNAEALFEPKIDGDHHDHIICLTCGKIFEFEDDAIEARQDAVAKARGFVVRRHRHEIYGDCEKPVCEHRPSP